MKRGSFFLAVLLLATLILSACGGSSNNSSSTTTPSASNDGSLDRVKKAGKLLVAIDPTYPPMEFIDKDGKTPIGFDIEIANALAQKLGVKAEFVTMDWDGIIPGLTGKRYDVIISSMNITDERLKSVNFVEYAKMSQVFVSKKGVQVKTENDLSGKIVAVQAETTSNEWVSKLKEQKVKDIKEIRTFKAATDPFLEVKNNRADVIVIDEPVGRYYAKEDAATFAVTGQALTPEPVGIAIRKEDGELKTAIDKAIKDLRGDGTYKKVSEKWFGGELGK